MFFWRVLSGDGNTLDASPIISCACVRVCVLLTNTNHMCWGKHLVPEKWAQIWGGGELQLVEMDVEIGSGGVEKEESGYTWQPEIKPTVFTAGWLAVFSL